MEGFSQLLADLEHRDRWRRERAQADVRRLGGEALPLLQQVLERGPGLARPAAAEALVAVGEEAIPCLRDALHSPDREARVWVVWCLKQIDLPAATDALVAGLQDPESVVRCQVVDALALRPGTPITQALCEAIRRDTDPSVRQRAVEVLGTRGELIAGSVLCAVLEDPASGVRGAVCTALGQLRAEIGVSGLLERLNDPVLYVRKSAVRALGAVGVSSAIVPLCRLLESLNVELREEAAEALVQLSRHHRLVVRHVADVIVTADAARQELAAEILVRSGTQAIPELCQLLGVTRTSARLAAARALRTIANREPTAYLRAAIPVLRRELGLLNQLAEPTRAELGLTLQRIEQVTQELKHLPIPAASQAHAARDYPLPAKGEEPAMSSEAEAPSAEAGDETQQGAHGTMGKQLVRLIRRLWRTS